MVKLIYYGTKVTLLISLKSLHSLSLSFHSHQTLVLYRSANDNKRFAFVLLRKHVSVLTSLPLALFFCIAIHRTPSLRCKKTHNNKLKILPIPFHLTPNWCSSLILQCIDLMKKVFLHTKISLSLLFLEWIYINSETVLHVQCENKFLIKVENGETTQ